MEHVKLEINIEMEEKDRIISISSPQQSFYAEVYSFERDELCRIINAIIDKELKG